MIISLKDRDFVGMKQETHSQKTQGQLLPIVNTLSVSWLKFHTALFQFLTSLLAIPPARPCARFC